MEQNKIEENRALVKKLIDKFDKCDWTKSLANGLFNLKIGERWTISLGRDFMIVFRDGMDMIREIKPSGYYDKVGLRMLYSMVSKRVEGKINEQLDKLMMELEKIK